MFTFLPRAADAMVSASASARVSIDAEGGTEAVMTSTPFIAKASVMPRQYWTPGRRGPASRSSEKPSSPCARITGCFGVSVLMSLHFLDDLRRN